MGWVRSERCENKKEAVHSKTASFPKCPGTGLITAMITVVRFGHNDGQHKIEHNHQRIKN